MLNATPPDLPVNAEGISSRSGGKAVSAYETRLVLGPLSARNCYRDNAEPEYRSVALRR